MDVSPRILVVDDDEAVRDSVCEYLALHGFTVASAVDGATMRERISETEPALVVLDVGLPGEGGLALARWIRDRGPTGIVMLTGHAEPVDRVVGLEIGADDYVSKPFVPRELVARIRAVLRRKADGERSPAHGNGTPPQQEANRIRFGTKWLDPMSRVLLDEHGRIHQLTASEFNLLKAFADHPRRVLSRDRLLDLAEARDPEAFDRAIDVRITRLRRKVEPNADRPTIIQTVRGAGYIFSPDGRILQ